MVPAQVRDAHPLREGPNSDVSVFPFHVHEILDETAVSGRRLRILLAELPLVDAARLRAGVLSNSGMSLKGVSSARLSYRDATRETRLDCGWGVTHRNPLYRDARPSTSRR